MPGTPSTRTRTEYLDRCAGQPRPVGHRRRAPQLGRLAGRHRRRVRVQDDVGIEHGQQRVAVACPGGGDERLGDRPLPGQPPRPRTGPLPGWPGGSSCPAAPRTRRLARLASCRAASDERPVIPAISSNGTPNMSCSTNATRSAGASRSSTTSSASPTESASTASCSGRRRRATRRRRRPPPAARIPPRPPPASSSRRACRERSMSRHTRDVIVVSQPSRLRDAVRARPGGAQPGLLHRVIRVAGRAEHPVGHRPQPSPVPLEPLGQQFVVHQPVTVTSLPSGSVIPMTGRIGPL